jgi:hypothetical protein
MAVEKAIGSSSLVEVSHAPRKAQGKKKTSTKSKSGRQRVTVGV